MDDTKKLYTPQEVADLLKVKRFTVYSWIRRGQLKALKIAGTVRIPASELEAEKEA